MWHLCQLSNFVRSWASPCENHELKWSIFLKSNTTSVIYIFYIGARFTYTIHSYIPVYKSPLLWSIKWINLSNSWGLYIYDIYIHTYIYIHCVYIYTLYIYIYIRCIYIYTHCIYPGWNYPGGPVQPFCSYDPLCAHFQSTKPSSQPKTVPYKMQWLLLFSCGKEHAFCSSPTFQLFRGRNAFCSGVFWGSKFITRCARPHFIALGRWLMEFFLQINGFFHLN